MFSLDSENKKLGYKSQKKNNTLLSSLFVSCVENATCLVVSFLLLLQTLSSCNKAEEMENIYCTFHTRRALMSVTIPSMYILPSVHQGDCFDLTAATWYAALPYMVGTCHCPSAAGQRGWQKHGGCLEVVFLPSPFKSTLQRAPLWPLMHPVHLAKQSCETQDHRHGQKQFHPLSEPISTSRFEDKQESDMFYCICLTYKLCILPSVIVMWLPTLVTCPSISVCLLFCQIPHILPLMGTKYTNLLVWEKTNIFLFSLLFPSRHCLRVRVAWAQRDEAASVWNQIQSWVMGKWWRGVLDALAQANGLAGSERLTVHYVRLRLDSIEGKLLLTALMSNKPLNSHIIVWYWWLWYFNWT